MDDFSKEARQEYHKQKCEELRKIRIKMAETLGIPEAVRKEPCNFDGVCSGTCPACYMEEQALMGRIYELSKNGMMDMIFGDTAKEIQDNAHAFDTDNAFFGESEGLEGDVMYDDTDESEEESSSNKYIPPVKNTTPNPLNMGLTGLIIPPEYRDNTTESNKLSEQEEIDKHKKQRTTIKIPDFLKGKKK